MKFCQHVCSNGLADLEFVAVGELQWPFWRLKCAASHSDQRGELNVLNNGLHALYLRTQRNKGTIAKINFNRFQMVPRFSAIFVDSRPQQRMDVAASDETQVSTTDGTGHNSELSFGPYNSLHHQEVPLRNCSSPYPQQPTAGPLESTPQPRTLFLEAPRSCPSPQYAPHFFPVSDQNYGFIVLL